MTEDNIYSTAKALEKFVEHLNAQGKSTNTVVAYKGDVSQLVNYLKSILVSDISKVNAGQVEDFKKNLAKGGYTAKSISRKLNSIKNFFGFLVNEGVLSIDPSKEIKHPKYENDKPRVFKPIEYMALRDACRNDIRATAIVELMLQAGLRISEIANLEIADIESNGIVISAYESHEQRTVPLNASAKKALKAYIEEERYETKSKKVFVTKTGRALLVRNIRSLLNRYFEKAEIKSGKVNDLRNTFISYQLEAGVPIDVVSKIVGHKRISTTEKYLGLIERKEEREEKGIKLKEL
jgi:integrase/recombinase XerD